MTPERTPRRRAACGLPRLDCRAARATRRIARAVGRALGGAALGSATPRLWTDATRRWPRGSRTGWAGWTRPTAFTDEVAELTAFAGVRARGGLHRRRRVRHGRQLAGARGARARLPALGARPARPRPRLHRPGRRRWRSDDGTDPATHAARHRHQVRHHDRDARLPGPLLGGASSTGRARCAGQQGGRRLRGHHRPGRQPRGHPPRGRVPRDVPQPAGRGRPLQRADVRRAGAGRAAWASTSGRCSTDAGTMAERCQRRRRRPTRGWRSARPWARWPGPGATS